MVERKVFLNNSMVRIILVLKGDLKGSEDFINGLIVNCAFFPAEFFYVKESHFTNSFLLTILRLVLNP